MKVCVVVVLVAIYASGSDSLECGFSQVNKEEIHQAIEMCITDTKSPVTSPPVSESPEDSSEDSGTVPPTETNKMGDTKDVKVKRTRRATKAGNDKSQSNDESDSKSVEDDVDTTTETATDGGDGFPDKCVIHCVLQRMNMTDDKELPDHSKFTENLLKNANGRELRNFLQETADECFQQLDNDKNDDPCDSSTKLITCLAERGKSNCADWPAGSIPF